MDKQVLEETAKAMVAEGKGILAADSSIPTMTKRLKAIDVESSLEMRGAFREIFITTDGMEKFISGMIFFDETIRQKTKDGVSFHKVLLDKGVMLGIKVDRRAWDMANFPGEKISDGLDGLRDRLAEYKSEFGVRFAKWRSVITIGDGIPTDVCIDSNADAMARYAALCQEADIVPIVEPEVIMAGNHDMKRDEEVTYSTLKKFFVKLTEHSVFLGGMILKTNMILPGKDNGQEVNDLQVADATLRVLKEVVPDEVPGIVFLSGGQNADDAMRRLNAISKKGKQAWEISFSFERALQEDAISIWKGKEENMDAARKAFYARAESVAKARDGKLDS